MADVVVQAQSTLFNRQGLTIQQRYYTLLPALINAVVNAYTNSPPAGSNFTALTGAIGNLLTQDSEVIPGGITLFNIQSLIDYLFNGAPNLQEIWTQNPFSTTYETSTSALYARQYANARSIAQSGPTNVRGGTARQGFELAELDTQQAINQFREIWQNQLAMADRVMAAIKLKNDIEAEIRREQLQAQQQQAATEQGRVMQTLSAGELLLKSLEANIRAMAAGAEFPGPVNMVTNEQLQGQGFQAGVTTGFGMSYWR